MPRADRFFKNDLKYFEYMTIESLKETIQKWGAPSPPPKSKKADLIKILNKFVKKNEINIRSYNRIEIKVKNGSAWYETRAYKDDRLFEKIDTLETYILKPRCGRPSFILKYDTTTGHWTKRLNMNITNNEPIELKGDRFVWMTSYYNELREIALYLELRNAFMSSLLFEEFLNKDIVNYIRYLL